MLRSRPSLKALERMLLPIAAKFMAQEGEGGDAANLLPGSRRREELWRDVIIKWRKRPVIDESLVCNGQVLTLVEPKSCT